MLSSSSSSFIFCLNTLTTYSLFLILCPSNLLHWDLPHKSYIYACIYSMYSILNIIRMRLPLYYVYFRTSINWLRSVCKMVWEKYFSLFLLTAIIGNNIVVAVAVIDIVTIFVHMLTIYRVLIGLHTISIQYKWSLSHRFSL